MGTVHLGRRRGHGGFARTVAIKRLHAHHARDPQLVQPFLKEARLASRIHHPNVVPTLDVVARHEELLVVMEYVHGCSLAQIIQSARSRGERIPAPIAVSIVAQALRGLHAAHEARSETGEPLGLVHRDVSPQNILIDTHGIARLVDFGVAKASGYAATTQQGQLKGKLAYMAPEQVTTGVVDRRTDVYAASIVLWELLTGARLFAGEIESITYARAARGGAPPVASRCTVDAAIAAAVDRALSIAPDDRFPSAQEMALALEACSPASTEEIAVWLASSCAEELARADARLARIERSTAEIGSADTSAPTAPPSSRGAPNEVTLTAFDRPPVRRSRRTWVLGATGGAVLVVGVAAYALVKARSAEASALVGTPRPPPAAPAPSVDDVASAPLRGAPPAPSAPASDVVSQTVPPAARTPAARPRASAGHGPSTSTRSAPPAASSAGSRCRIEAFTGEDGLKHYRETCR